MKIKVEGSEKNAVIGFKTLVARTNKANPSPEAMQELEQVFDSVPSLALQLGDLQGQIFHTLVDTAAGNSALVREATNRYVVNMKTEMGYETSTFVEKMLIDEIAMRWLRLVVMDNVHKNVTYGSHTIDEGMYCDKRLHLAQKRYLRAIETLAKVRKMIAQTQAKGAEMFKNLMKPED